jgi:Abnormal spindle-like microcephaly-assoc'd, ASPM-SPD-2-Hydin
MSRIQAPFLAVLFVFLSPLTVFCQANINEGLESAFVYVDALHGSDGNPGTITQPLQTIGAAAAMAIQNNQNGTGTRVTINPGTYRESVTLNSSSKATDLPITFEAATAGTAVVSGADVWTGWQTYSQNPQIYTNSWPYQWGLCPPDSSGSLQQDIILRREMIIVNGTPLTQVLSLNEVVVGTFYVDETKGTVYVWPPAGTSMASATVQVATRSDILSDSGLSNLVLRGLTFQYDNSCKGNSAVTIFQAASNVLIDTDNFNWNNATGLNLQGTTYVTVQNTIANHNGAMGMTSVKTKYGLWQNDQGSYDNWRGAQGAYLWGGGGIHFYQMHDDTITNSAAYYNQSHGLHYDTDNADITVDSFTSSQNLGSTLLIEKSEGPISVSNSSFCNGNAPANSTNNDAVSVNNSEFVTLNGDSIYNAGNQISVAGVQGGFIVTNWETGQVYDLSTQNLTLTENTIEAVGSGQGVFHDAFGGTDWTNFKTTFASDYNTWWNASNSTPFTIPGSSHLNFSGWKSTMLTDPHSVWQAPSVDPSIACQVTPDAPDFWLWASVDSLTVRPTTAAVFTATVTSLGFTGTINLSSDGVQSIPGATASWSSNTITNSGTTTFTVNTTSATPAGSYPVVLMATSGSVTRTVTISVIVDSNVTLSTGSLTFPSQEVGTTSGVQVVTLTNNGSSALSINSITISGTGESDFGETNTCGASLGSAQKCSISVIFSPEKSEALSATLSISDSDATSPQSVALSGTGTSPAATLSTHSLSFGGQVIGTGSAPLTATLTNTGTGALTISKVAITGTNPSSFTQSNNCGSSLAVGALCTFTVTFTPSTTGSMSAVLTITDNAGVGSQTVNLMGNGKTSVSLSRTSINFSNREVGTTSSVQTVTLTNLGNKLTVQSISITGTNPGDFAQTNNCAATVAAGASCTINVTFTPTASGTRSASVTISDSDPTSPQSVSLTGSGTTSPAATLSTHFLSFGGQVVGTGSAPLTATLTNTGTGALTISKVAVTGTNPSSFTQSNNCGSSLAVGALCTLTVTFTPSTTGSMSAALTITDNAGAGTQTVNLSGNGKTAVSLSPSAIGFSSHKVGTTSGAQTITLTNLGNKLTMNSISITGTKPGDFAQTNNCGASVAAGASCIISVTFTPGATGIRSANVNISDSDLASPQSVSLSGTGS